MKEIEVQKSESHISKELLEFISSIPDEYHPKLSLNFINFDFENNRISATDTRRLIIAYVDFPTNCKGAALANPKLIQAMASLRNNISKQSFSFKDNQLTYGEKIKLNLDNILEINSNYPDTPKIIEGVKKKRRGLSIHGGNALYEIHRKGIFINEDYLKDVREFMIKSNEDYTFYLHLNGADSPLCIECIDKKKNIIFDYVVMPIVG